MRITAFIIAAAVTVASRAGAQSVPDFALDLAAGTGAHTRHAASEYYMPEREPMFRATGTFALGRRGAVRPILTIDATTRCIGFLCAQDDVCPVAPDGGCEKHFRPAGGVGLAAGAEAAWSEYLVGAVSGGMASPFDRHVAFIGANLGLRLSSHIAWTFDFRRYRFDNAQGERVWFAPFTVGLRFY